MNEDGSANSANSPAASGSMVTLRLTGHRGRRISVQMGGRPAEVDTYQDAISGAKTNRLNRLMADALARTSDCLLVWKLDRFGRSLVDCLNNIRTLENHGVRFIAVTQGLDTDQRNPASRFLLHVLGAAAEFERALIRERTRRSRPSGRRPR